MSITITTRLLVEESEKLGVETEVISAKHNLLVLKYKDKEVLVRRAVTPVTSAVLRYVADHKDATYDVLDYYGFSVPKTVTVNSVLEAMEASREIGYPLVVKPEDSAYGLGVTVSVNNEEQLRVAYEHAYSINQGDVLVQNLIKGDDYRIMVVDYKVCAIAKRIPCRVLGDGDNTIEKLIEIENKNPMRGKGKTSPMTLINIDDDMKDYLTSQKLTLDDISSKGEYVYLRKIANLSQGGEAENMTDICSDNNKRLFESMAKALQASVVGIDILCEDLGKNLTNNDYAVIEVNASPGIRMHHYPAKGKSINIAKKILVALFPELKDK